MFLIELSSYSLYKNNLRDLLKIPMSGHHLNPTTSDYRRIEPQNLLFEQVSQVTCRMVKFENYYSRPVFPKSTWDPCSKDRFLYLILNPLNKSDHSEVGRITDEALYLTDFSVLNSSTMLIIKYFLKN